MKNKVVIITGASSGIGKALALAFAAKGAKLSLLARNAENLSLTANECHKLGAEAITIPTDVSNEESCRLAIDKTIEKFGRIDILINNAGMSMRALFSELDLDVIRKLMDVNFWGTVYCTKYALPWLLKTKGVVVGVSSVAGFTGLPARSGYSASKFAMHGLLETIRIENLNNGLHVLIVSPGFTASNIRKTALVANGSQQGETPRKEEKMMSAEKVADSIIRGIEKRKRFMVMTSTGKLTFILKKFFPALIDRMAYNMMAKEPDSPLKKNK